MVHRFRTFSLTVCCALLCASAAASAAAPTTTTVEGALTSVGGGAVADGVYVVVVSIYEGKTATKAAWSEGPLKISVKGGRFTTRLGLVKALDGKVLAALKAPWMGVKVAADPELPRQPLNATPYAMVAGRLTCSGCVGDAQLAPSAISATKIGFTYAASKTKGGAASDLACTGCVSVTEMKFDGDIDLAGNSLKAKNGVFTGEVTAGLVTASSFSGDGSKLSGIKIPTGACKVAGEVVKGINADGTLQCVKAMDPAALPKDGLNEISNNLLTNQFTDVIEGAGKMVKIPDNQGVDAISNLTFPDIGVAQAFSLTVHVENTDLSTVAISVLPPDDKKVGWVLCDPCGAKNTKVFKKTFDLTHKPKSGNLAARIGTNPKGLWNLKVSDTSYCAKNAPGNGTYCDVTHKTDGWITAWNIGVQTLSTKKVQANGLLIAAGGFRLKTATSAPIVCGPTYVGYLYFDTKLKALQVCNGKKFFAIATDPPLGSQGNAAVSCKAILDGKASVGDGTYWLDPDGASGPGNKFQAWCDMTTDGGGWTLVLSARRLNQSSFARHGSATWDSNIATVNPALKSTYYLNRTVPFASGMRVVCFNNETKRSNLQGATVDIKLPAATATAFKTYMKANTAVNIGDTSSWYDISKTKRFGSNGPDDFYVGGPIYSPQYQRVNWGWVDNKGSTCTSKYSIWSGGMAGWPNGQRRTGDWFILVR